MESDTFLSGILLPKEENSIVRQSGSQKMPILGLQDMTRPVPGAIINSPNERLSISTVRCEGQGVT